MNEYVGLNHRQVISVLAHHLCIPDFAYLRQLIYQRTAVQTRQWSTNNSRLLSSTTQFSTNVL